MSTEREILDGMVDMMMPEVREIIWDILEQSKKDNPLRTEKDLMDIVMCRALQKASGEALEDVIKKFNIEMDKR